VKNERTEGSRAVVLAKGGRRPQGKFSHTWEIRPWAGVKSEKAWKGKRVQGGFAALLIT